MAEQTARRIDSGRSASLYSELDEQQANREAAALLPSVKIYAGIFMISAATLLFELALTRIFAVVLWAHLAFMVVGSALFGFGLSGVYLALSRRRPEQRYALGTLALFLSGAIIMAYLVITNVPFQMWNFKGNPLNYVYLACWYIACVIPFFIAGQIIARILNDYPSRCNRLYGFDLIGAAVGSLLLVPVIPLVGGVGTLVFAALMAALVSVMLAPRRAITIAGAASAVVLALVLLSPESVLPLKFYTPKRDFRLALRKGGILATRWSPISRVDIARFKAKEIRKLWIDGGTNESAIYHWSGKTETMKPMSFSSIGTAYNFKLATRPNPRVLIIGPSGGGEVMVALSHGVSKIDAVELDPSIVKLLTTKRFAEWMGDLYLKDKVNLVNDEGRAYLRRQPTGTYDVIQFVNNYTPVAMASGALNLSETFLITKEAFVDFWNGLSDQGVLALHRGATLRVALTAIEALREMGVPSPESHILISSGEVPFFEGFYLKKTPWQAEEVAVIERYMRGRTTDGFLWNPVDRTGKGLYPKILGGTAEEQQAAYTGYGVNLFPATDDSPFVEHYLQIGKQTLSDELPQEFTRRNTEKIGGLIPRGDFPYVVILAESALLALLFVLVPLGVWARNPTRSQTFSRVLTYFACLGFGFIVVEICLMKRYVLFLGNPAYSITTILVALLLGAGAGSLVSQRYAATPLRALKVVLPLVALAIAAETLLAPSLFQAFMRFEFSSRVFIAAAMLFPLGFVMGMPFPLGMQVINQLHPEEEERRRVSAWAWGMNGYTTVLGSALSVFIALLAGFKSVLVLGVLTYLLALVCVWSLARQRAR